MSTSALVERYLGELGQDRDPGPPSEAALRALHRAHAERFAHDTLWKMRGRIPRCTDADLVEALLAGEGGGCLHLNGGFCWLLRQLGYDASLHPARVQRAFDPELPERYEHAVVTVRLGDQTWYVDVGLGNGLLEAVPLREGPIHQSGGFEYRLEQTGPQTWRFHHDRRLMAMRLLEFDLLAWAVEDFAEIFQHDATDPSSHSLRQIMLNRRRQDGVSVLVGNTLVRRGEQRRSLEEITSSEHWEDVMRREFGLRLPEWCPAERDRLWALASGAAAR